MIISNAHIDLASTHQQTEINRQSHSLQLWIGNTAPLPSQTGGAGNVPQRGPSWEQLADHVELSDQAQRLRPSKTTKVAKEHVQSPSIIELKFSILKKLIEALTGKEIKTVSPEDFDAKDKTVEVEQPPASPAEGSAAPREGFGLVYEYHESHYESEQTSFNASGEIKTADGKSIQFDVSLNMSREFARQTDVVFRAGDAVLKDPLVVNFKGTAAELTETHFAFDLDSDGHTEEVAFVRPGSGFLALDKNGNGIVDDGNELFGPQSGRGFDELATYDEDHNGWIDEVDSVFSQLRIWQKGPDGSDHLFSLLEKGVGAIYLKNVTTPFAIKDTQNELQGQIQSTGLHVQEDGTVGTIQQVDLVV